VLDVTGLQTKAQSRQKTKTESDASCAAQNMQQSPVKPGSAKLTVPFWVPLTTSMPFCTTWRPGIQLRSEGQRLFSCAEAAAGRQQQYAIIGRGDNLESPTKKLPFPSTKSRLKPLSGGLIRFPPILPPAWRKVARDPGAGGQTNPQVTKQNPSKPNCTIPRALPGLTSCQSQSNDETLHGGASQSDEHS
jgi:hypothetical protein